MSSGGVESCSYEIVSLLRCTAPAILALIGTLLNKATLRRSLEPKQYTSIAFGLRCKRAGVPCRVLLPWADTMSDTRLPPSRAGFGPGRGGPAQ